LGRVSRHLPVLFVVLLVAATVATFARTELLKLEPNPIAGPRFNHQQFSPVCGCPQTRTVLSFRLRRADRVKVSIVNANGHTIAVLDKGRRLPAGRSQFIWNGRDSDGAVVAEGTYRPKLELDRHGRTIVLPTRVHVDTTRPTVMLVSAGPRTISPDGDKRREVVRVRYRVSEPANGILLVNGVQRVRNRFRPLEGTLAWSGRVRRRGVPPGRYRLQVVAVDQAGNRSKPIAIDVRVRYVDLFRKKIRVLPGRQFGVRYTTEARTVRWQLGPRSGIARGGRIVVRAPQVKGRYTLVVSANGHSARAAVQVGRPRRAK
jgi:hypothetical protein